MNTDRDLRNDAVGAGDGWVEWLARETAADLGLADLAIADDDEFDVGEGFGAVSEIVEVSPQAV